MLSQTTLSLTIARRIGFVILAVMFGAGAMIAILGRGPWYDEFYSLYVVRPGAPLSTLYPAWLRDNHPPLFYALAWAWSRLIAGTGFGGTGLAGTIAGMRAINCVLLVTLVWVLGRLARADAWFARILWYDGLALAATFPALDQIGQLRSYFLSFVLAAIVLPLLARDILGHAGRWTRIALGLVLAVAFSVHVLTTVIIGSLVAATVLHHAFARRWNDACRLTAIAALALIPFAITMAIQFSTIAANTRVFWIPGGFNAGRWAIETEVHDAVYANPVLLLVALAGLAVTLPALRRRDPDAQMSAVVIITFAAGLALAVAVLMAAHLYRPMLVSRYLVALDPIIALILAIGAHAATRRLAVRAVIVIDMLVLLATGFAIHANCLGTIAKPSWDGTGMAIARIVHACPQATVHPDLHWNTLALDMPPRDNRAVVPFAYRFEAHRMGFALSPAGSLSPGGANSLSATCPNVFWTEHVANRHPTAQAIIDALRRAGYPIRSGRVERSGIGWILVTPPIA
ncbi:hypothetical protein [Novosphingobium sp.]|uniref:hypothetical protein n=1 Tax=Novosphingobium sp. TaxID=1874826 RepID=UPI003B524C06